LIAALSPVLFLLTLLFFASFDAYGLSVRLPRRDASSGKNRFALRLFEKRMPSRTRGA
jgi:hypothetical protein